MAQRHGSVVVLDCHRWSSRLQKIKNRLLRELHQRGHVRWLGHYDAVTDDGLFHALQAAMSYEELESWSQDCMTITSGDGVKRVASVLALNSGTKLLARRARLDDESLVASLGQ